MPKISVIVPAYNAEERIKITIDSLINQTYDDFEVVIIDDGSTDNTSEIVKKTMEQDDRIKYFYQENQGVSSARNNGIKESRGEYISFLDSDDYYHVDFLSKMYTKINIKKFDVCYSGYNTVNKKNIEQSTSNFSNENVGLKYILNKINVHTNSWLIKKEYLLNNNILFPVNVSWGEDFEFFCNVLFNTNKITFVSDYLTYYVTDHSNTQLSIFSLKKLDEDYESIMRLVNEKSINQNKKIENALIKYHLSALIVYRLIEAYKLGFDRKEIELYYQKYKKYIIDFSFNNGLRSVKLNLYKIYLLIK